MKNIRSLALRAARSLGFARRNGYIDSFTQTRAAGWAFDPAAPGMPVLISLHIDGVPAMNIIADMARDDVQAAGLGPRRSGFDTTLPKRLRDGKAHIAQLRLGVDGPVLPGGTLKVPARGHDAPDDGADIDAGAAAEAGAPQGVAFFKPRNATIEGWASGCASVTVEFANSPTRTVTLDRIVPGFGTGSRQGFAIAIPVELMDGQDHSVDVRFEAGGLPLDGTPVVFATHMQAPRIAVLHHKGTRLTLGVRDVTGHPVTQRISVHADAEPLAVHPVPDRPGEYDMTVPDRMSWLVVQDEADRIIARFAAQAGHLQEPLIPAMPKTALDPDVHEKARVAFDAFCAAPDARFDALWYRWAQDGARGQDEAALIAHYRAHAGAGASPGPYFNETTARRMYPGLNACIDAGALPCAFALELVLGQGALNTLAHLAPTQANALHKGREAVETLLERAGRLIQPGPAPVPLRARPLPPLAAQSPADYIYAAWVSRLKLKAAQRSVLAEDEIALRRDVAAIALTRTPLVSVIMPSWNRAFTIGEAIQSLLDQTYQNWELIVADDASQDRTADVVRGFDDPRIRYMSFLKSNGAGARNNGLRFARGEYIAYLDSDNIWHPQFLDLMLRHLMASPGHMMAYCAYLDTEIDGAHVHLREIARPRFRVIALSSKNAIDLNTIVHHRRIHDWLGGFDTDLPRLQDWDLALRYTGVFRPLCVDRIGVFYRRNPAWGQVTHLHMNSGAQNTVNEKTRARLHHGHERLDIPWPGRGQITVLCGTRCGDAATQQVRLLSQSIAGMAADQMDINLVILADTDTEAAPASPPMPEGVTCHVIPADLARDPVQLGMAMAFLIRGQVIISVGLDGNYLRAIPGLNPERTYRLRDSADGTVLQGLDVPTVRFDLGALPLDVPEGQHMPADATVLVILPKTAKRGLVTELEAEARRRGLQLLIAPGRGHGWQIIEKGDAARPLGRDVVWPPALRRCAMTACLGPVSELGAFDLALLTALQGCGVPAAVLPDAGKTRHSGMANQWIEARAVYEIQVNTPKWILDKLRKLISDAPGMEQLRDRSITVYRIASPPDLVRERLLHAVYRMVFAPPKREVLDAHT